MNIQVRSGLYWTHLDLSTSTLFIILFSVSWGRDQTQSFGNGRQELYNWAVAPVLICLFCFNIGSHVTQDGFNSQSSGLYLSSATGGYQHTQTILFSWLPRTVSGTEDDALNAMWTLLILGKTIISTLGLLLFNLKGILWAIAWVTVERLGVRKMRILAAFTLVVYKTLGHSP